MAIGPSESQKSRYSAYLKNRPRQNSPTISTEVPILSVGSSCHPRRDICSPNFVAFFGKLKKRTIHLALHSNRLALVCACLRCLYELGQYARRAVIAHAATPAGFHRDNCQRREPLVKRIQDGDVKKRMQLPAHSQSLSDGRMPFSLSSVSSRRAEMEALPTTVCKNSKTPKRNFKPPKRR